MPKEKSKRFKRAPVTENFRFRDVNEKYRFLNPYNFVRYINRSRPQGHILGDCPPPPHDRYVGLTGRIRCEAEAVTPLFISDSHAMREDNNGHRTYRFFQLDGEPALPASSLRGMVRAVFEAVTNSCFVVFDGEARLFYRDINAARRMKPGIVQTLARADEPGTVSTSSGYRVLSSEFHEIG